MWPGGAVDPRRPLTQKSSQHRQAVRARGCVACLAVRLKTCATMTQTLTLRVGQRLQRTRPLVGSAWLCARGMVEHHHLAASTRPSNHGHFHHASCERTQTSCVLPEERAHLQRKHARESLGARPSQTGRDLLPLLLLLAEVAANLVIVLRVPYTEIDWQAYMSEVEGAINGTYDYTKLEGGTGPLVYPAGFVYIFAGLYYATDHGTAIFRAQLYFAALYVATLVVVYQIYRICKLHPLVLVLLSASYRMHSIYALRLFNDPVAMILLYLAVLLFLKRRWTTGCILFSLAVSVKMNILLFAPGLAILLMFELGVLHAFLNIALCGLIQLGLAWPFLMVNAWGYLVRSFNLGRQFFYIWTVNWRCVSEDVFLDRRFQLALLLGHVALLAWFAWRRWLPRGALQLSFGRPAKPAGFSPRTTTLILFTSNLIGIAFSRSLHYQFYSWYWHTLPFLLWCTRLPIILRLVVLAAIEYSWNVYPSTVTSSLVLHAAHAILLIALALVDPHALDNRRSAKV
eukprot:m.152115 g.152115  ORF g.152115 m.152115 type:complete len:514 (-) comp10159_c3_seq7:1210-2751(-)